MPAIGSTLGEYERRYDKAAAQLRVPRARKALVKLFFLIGVNENTPDKEVQARLDAADKVLAEMPELSAYVKAYYQARDEYSFASVVAYGNLRDLEEKYDKEVPGFAAGLRDRAGVLGRISANLKEVAEEIMNSPFIYFPAGEMAWFDFDHLAERFGILSGRLAYFAGLVEQRKADYPGEMKRIDGASKKLQRRLTEMM